MFRTMVHTQLILFAMSVNAFIYRLQHIPLIGKCIPDKCYKATGLKTVMGVFSFVTGVIGAILKKILYFFLLYFIPALIIGDLVLDEGFSDAQLWNCFCLFFLITNLLSGSFTRQSLGDYGENDRVMLHLMRVEEKPYYLGKIIKRCVLDVLAFIPAMLIVTIGIGDKGIMESIVLVILLCAFRFIAEYVSLVLQTKLTVEKYGMVNSTITIMLCATVLIGYALFYWFDGNMTLGLLIFHPFFIAVTILVGAYAIVCLCRYNEYKMLAMQQLTYTDELEDDTQEGNVNKEQIAIHDEDVTHEDIHTNKFEHLKGYEYLNALFFARHKRLVRRKWKIKVWLISIISVLIWVIMAISRINGESAEVLQDVDKVIPLGICLMYLMCSGESLCKAFFFHCDNSLLKYGYYRNPKTLLKNFKIRLRYLVILDIQPALLLCAGIAVSLCIIGNVMTVIHNIPILITLLLLSVFFDVYQLLLYYVFQPFLENYQTKSAGYSICNYAMYYFCFFGVKDVTASAEFTISVLVFTLICIPISYGLIYYLAPKRFKLR